MSQHPLLPPTGAPKPFNGPRGKLLRIAALSGLYLLLVLYPAYLWLTDTVPTANHFAVAVLCAAAYATYAYREMKRLSPTPSKPDKTS